VKKINGKPAKEHYENIDLETGEIVDRLPEYTTMSLKDGGIAGNWFKKWKGDVYPSDSVVVRGREMKPPKFYDRLLELEDPVAREAIKQRRLEKAAARAHDNTTARLRVRETVKLAQSKMLKRGIE